MCLIDGDGNIFSPELVSKGQQGADDFAIRLLEGIKGHIQELKDDPPIKNPEIWLTICCNLKGLQSTLIKNQCCTVEQYDAFIEGFNNGDPLFSIIDGGSAKQAADKKLKGWYCPHCAFVPS